MSFDFSFLDYVWRGLTVGTLTSLIILATLFATALLINSKATRQQMKYFFHSQILLLSTVFVGSFLWVACVDPELASGCFSLFAKDKSFFTLTRLFAAVWMLGFASLGIYDLYRILKPAQTDLQAVTDESLKKQFQSLLQKFGIRKEVGLYVSADCASPYAIGGLRPYVVLPSGLIKLESQSLQHILAHELVHVRDQDSAWKALELFARRILFFNPLMYLVAQRHLLAIEKAADEAAVQTTGAQARDYIETLIEVVSRHRATGQNPLALNASRSFRETKERMEALVLSRKLSPKKNFVNSVILGSFLMSLGISVAQARSTVQEAFDGSLEKGLMCSQVQHEKVIESWLRIEAPANKCE